MNKANYFEPGSSKRREVHLKWTNDRLEIYEKDALLNSVNLKECKFDSPISKHPIRCFLPDNGLLELPFDENLVQELRNKKLINPILYSFENNLKIFLMLCLCFIVSVFLIFKLAIPATSTFVAQYIPQTWTNNLETLVLKQLDSHLFTPSKLSQEESNEILNVSKSLGDTKLKIEFRDGDSLGPNAFALLGQTIIVTDELTKLLNENEIKAVLLHEAGHVHYRHGLSTVLQYFSTAAFVTMMFGDFFGGGETITQIAFALVTLKYKRSLELQADEYAVNELIKNKISPLCLIDALEKITKTTDNKNSKALQIISTHPENNERKKNLMTLFPTSQACKF